MSIIRSYKGMMPDIADDVFVAENAVVIGDVVIGKQSSIWYNVVVRGDVNYIRIGERTNIQDGSILHVTNDLYPLVLGNNVNVAHSVTLHGCTIEDNVLIGIGANVLDNALIGCNSIVAAGSLVLEGTVVPPGVLIAGVPAKVKREINDEERELIKMISTRYIDYAKTYLEE